MKQLTKQQIAKIRAKTKRNLRKAIHSNISDYLKQCAVCDLKDLESYSCDNVLLDRYMLVKRDADLVMPEKSKFIPQSKLIADYVSSFDYLKKGVVTK